jgi:hydrogenase nickel incorporation protein HypA/HybF
MHELRIVTEIIGIVNKEMHNRGLSGLSEVGVNLGALTGIDKEALAFGFEAATKDTPLAGTHLNIDFIPVSGKCRSCRKNFELTDFVFICPGCGSADLEITHGEELEVAYLIEK